jgi:hypothetical protein
MPSKTFPFSSGNGSGPGVEEEARSHGRRVAEIIIEDDVRRLALNYPQPSA